MSVVSKFAQVIHWSPVGRLVAIRIEDSRDRGLVGKAFSALIIKLGSDGGATLRLSSPLVVDRAEEQVLEAIPRHAGFDFLHLLFGRIVVSLVPAADVSNPNARFATAEVVLERRATK